MLKPEYSRKAHLEAISVAAAAVSQNPQEKNLGQKEPWVQLGFICRVIHYHPQLLNLGDLSWFYWGIDFLGEDDLG